MFARFRPALAGLVMLASTAACADAGSNPAATDPTPAPAAELARLECTVTVADGRMACQGAAPSTGDASGLVVGGQGLYVELTASNNAYDAGTQLYSMDVTVQNLMFQPLGTTDGTTLDPKGVMVLFDVEPYATSGSPGTELDLAGSVQRAPLLRSNQAYYQYDQVIQPNATSAPVTWQVSRPVGVTSFRFIVYVMAQVPYPQGRINLSPAADTLLEGQAQALTAVSLNAYGKPLDGDMYAWGTSDPAVATVDASGVVTAVAPGAATITATAGPRSGSANIVVCPDLSVGEAYTLSMPAAANLCLGGGAEGAEYTYMPVNLSTSSSLSLSVTASGITAAAGPPSPALLPNGSQSRVLDAPMVDDGGFHVRQMERDFRELAPLARRPASRVIPGRGNQRRVPGGPSMAITPGTPALGDLWSLNTAPGCSGTPDFRTGRVVSIGQHVIIVADTANPVGGFTTAQYDSIRMEFDSLAYPVNVANFGEPADLDDNDRVVAFYTRAVNELSPPASSAVVGGYVAPRDMFAADASCPRSNVGEIFYMLVPDITGAVNSNVRSISFVRGGTVGTLAHEFQHLINTSRRLYVHEATTLEEVWLNEGLSHIAEELMFYRTAAGLAPRGNVALATITSGPNASRRVAAFNTYANQNFGRLRSWLQRPDTTGAFKTSDGLATRGATWAFLRYVADRRNGTDAQLWYDLVNTQATGKANLQAVMGVNPDTWLRDFTSAMYADDAVAGIGPEQQVTSWNFRSVYGGLGGVPHGPRALTNGVALTLSYSRGGGTAYTRFGVPADGFASVTALSGSAVPTSPYALIVVRTK